MSICKCTISISLKIQHSRAFPRDTAMTCLASLRDLSCASHYDAQSQPPKHLCLLVFKLSYFLHGARLFSWPSSHVTVSPGPSPHADRQPVEFSHCSLVQKCPLR